MEKPDKSSSVSLESLLKLKRCEQPDDAFWDSFEKDFHRRRLNSLVEKTDPWRIWGPLVKWMGVAVPALGLLALGVLGWPSQEPALPVLAEVSSEDGRLRAEEGSVNVAAGMGLADGPGALVMSDQLSSQFVLDALEQRASTTHAFRKVLYTPALEAPVSSGASYVRDSLTARAYSVTTADVKLGRNF